MIIVSYDISNDKTRTKFNKYLKKFGRSLQFSVIEIKNSTRILNKIILEIEKTYKPKFQASDSVLLFMISEADEKKIIRYGWTVQEERSVVFFD
jgi:CRISPR-associated protein Cas2